MKQKLSKKDYSFLVIIVVVFIYFIRINSDSVMNIVVFVFSILWTMYPWFSSKFKKLFLLNKKVLYWIKNKAVFFEISIEIDSNESVENIHNILVGKIQKNQYKFNKKVWDPIVSNIEFNSKEVKNLKFILITKKMEKYIVANFNNITLPYRDSKKIIYEVMNLLETIQKGLSSIAIDPEDLKISLELDYTDDNPYINYYLDSNKIKGKDLSYVINICEKSSKISIRDDKINVISYQTTSIQSLFEEYVLFDKK